MAYILATFKQFYSIWWKLHILQKSKSIFLNYKEEELNNLKFPKGILNNSKFNIRAELKYEYIKLSSFKNIETFKDLLFFHTLQFK